MLDAVAHRLEQLNGPLGQRLRQAFTSAIDDGTLAVNVTLPSERDIAAQLGISRTTVRACLKDLAERGFVHTRHGAGTVVSNPIPKALTRLSGFTEDVRARGMQASSDVLERRIAPISAETAMRLGLPLGTPMMGLVRLRRANDEALSYETAVVPVDAVGEAYDGIGSLYDRMDTRGRRPRRILQTLEAVAAPDDIAMLLGIASGAPILRIAQTGYDAHGRAVEDATSWYRGDRYRYVGEMEG